MYKVFVSSMMVGLLMVFSVSSMILAEQKKASKKYDAIVTSYENHIKTLEEENQNKHEELKEEISELINTNNSLVNEITDLTRKVESIKVIEKPVVYTISMSFYTASSDETDSTPNRTASGTKPTVGRTIAVSPDLFPVLKGKRVVIEGFPGVYTVEDRMNDRFRMKADLLVGSKSEAFKKGVKHDIKMLVVPTI